jgi:hypothetical protein
MKIKNIIGLCSAAALLASSAYATPSNAIRFSTTGLAGSWTTVTDGGAGDLSVVSGNIIATVSMGGFTVVVSSSFTFPASGTLGSPAMDLQINGVTGGTGQLFVEFSSSGFTPVPSGAITTTIAPNEPGVTESETTRVSADAGGLFGTGTSFATLGPISSGSQTSQGVVPAGLAPYTITIADVFTSGGAGITLSSDDRLAVPDGGNTLMLLGSALSVLGFGVFRKSRKA